MTVRHIQQYVTYSSTSHTAMPHATMQHEVDLLLIEAAKDLLRQYANIDTSNVDPEEDIKIGVKNKSNKYKTKVKIIELLSQYQTACSLSRGPDKNRSLYWSEKANERRIALKNLVNKLSNKVKDEVEV